MKDWTRCWKDKETEELVTLVSKSCSGTGSKIIFINGTGESSELEESDFYDKFDPVHLDFQTIKDQIAELCNLNDRFGVLGRVVMKRLDPKYFEVGKLVYISNTIILKRDDITYYGGPEHPYVIVSINSRIGYYGENHLEVGIKSIRKIREEIDYTFPIYPTRPDPEDAYWFLTRYDKPY